MFRRRWYLVANSTYYKEVRVYGLDRIVSLEIEADCRFDLPKDFDAKGFFADCFGVIPDKRVPLRGCC
ncbi:MAG: WYL domain-containing protein [Prevotella sp.]|nr:WYL domain-containing protein [Prevotella sp.]